MIVMKPPDVGPAMVWTKSRPRHSIDRASSCPGAVLWVQREIRFPISLVSISLLEEHRDVKFVRGFGYFATIRPPKARIGSCTCVVGTMGSL